MNQKIQQVLIILELVFIIYYFIYFKTIGYKLLDFFKYHSLYLSLSVSEFDTVDFKQDPFIGFSFLFSPISLYFVTNTWGNRIYIFDDSWQFVTFKSLFMPKYIITIGSDLFITGQDNIFKTDKDINVLAQSNPNGKKVDEDNICKYCNGYGYMGLHFMNNSLYVAHFSLELIEIYDLNLVPDTAIELYGPWSISSYLNQIYVGDIYGTIHLIENKKIVKEFDGCLNNSLEIFSIIFDQQGFMGTACGNDINLFSEGSFKNERFSFDSEQNLYYVGYDSEGRFVILSSSAICM